MRLFLLAIAILLQASCLMRHRAASFAVIPHAPDYLLRSPDAVDTPFREVLRRYNHFEPAADWMDLHPWMDLRIENAYYKDGFPKRGLDGYLGTEVARYQVIPKGGLRQVSVRSMKDRPADQPPVEDLISRTQRRFQYYRYYFAIVFNKDAKESRSVLLGANSNVELDRLANALAADPDSVCSESSAHCIRFPEGCSVSIEMQIVVNGQSRTVLWGSTLGSIANHSQDISLLRQYEGHMVPVAVNAGDPNALRLPLLPGDRISWQ
jgi:hypothetical protein